MKGYCETYTQQDEERMGCKLPPGHEGDHEWLPVAKPVRVIHMIEDDVLTLAQAAKDNEAPDVIVALLDMAWNALHEACLYATDIWGEAGCKPAAPAREEQAS